MSFNVAASGWPNDAHRTAAVNAIQSTVNRYNAYGDFGNYNVHVYYNAGIPTAQANYLGSIGFGGTYPNERVMMHEMAHYLGSGTYGDPWDGARGEALIDQFDNPAQTERKRGASAVSLSCAGAPPVVASTTSPTRCPRSACARARSTTWRNSPPTGARRT